MVAHPALAQDAGVLVAPGIGADGTDPRLGRLVGGFSRAGLESFAAADMARPPPNPDRPIIRGRWRIEDARRLRLRRRYEEAAEAADHAVSLLERHAYDVEHLRFIVDAYVERGATALALQDSITAETMFLRAVALSPNHRPSSSRFSKSVLRLFAEVRRAARLLRYGSVRIDAPGIDDARISIDFGPDRSPPYEARLPDGRHFISIRASGRQDITALIRVRAERQASLVLRPPTSGDPKRRVDALNAYDARRTPTLVQLAQASGLRYVAVVSLGSGVMQVDLHDGRTGRPLGPSATMSGDPAAAEIDAAVDSLMQRVLSIDPNLFGTNDSPAWYGTWWGVTLIGVAVAATAATTAVLITRDDTTEYRFEP